MLAALDAFSSNYLQGRFIILLNAFLFFFFVLILVTLEIPQDDYLFPLEMLCT